jgi:hypothetical protein
MRFRVVELATSYLLTCADLCLEACADPSRGLNYCWDACDAGFRERLMADSSFFVKVGIECGIGIVTKCAAEKEKRKGRFTTELDFVTANVIMAIIADFMLVWLPAPTMSFSSAASCKTSPNLLSRFLACCPDNAFQKVPEGSH